MALPNMRLDGKVALITGAAGGIGKAVTEAYAESGADCILCELPQKMAELNQLCEVVRLCGRKAMPLSLQVRDLENINSVVDAAVEEMGRIDILVNSAGVNRAIDAFEVTEEDWDFILDINLKGLFFLTQRVGREMKERGGGKIINMASIMGMVGYYQRAPYCSSKAGIVNLTRVLAIEWAPHKINVNAIGPTFLVTPLTQAYFDDPQQRDEMARRQPVQRPGQPEDVTGAAVFLASEAADLITGHTMMVDGGWTAW